MTLLDDARKIIHDSIEAVLPEAAVERALSGRPLPTQVRVVAIGKAAWRMASAASRVLGDKVHSGVVITKYGHSGGALPRMTIVEAGHPVPDANGVEGAHLALELTEGLGPDDVVVFLVSGGGSALFELPAPGVTLADIAGVTRQLLACGADIVELNTIRKHLSAVKGGHFALHCAPARVLAIVLSDVLGDPLDAIASGPAYPDQSTSEDALRIVKQHGLSLPAHVLDALGRETPKSLDNVTTEITGNVQALCDAAMTSAKALGYAPLLLTTTLDVEARDAGGFLAAIARQIRLNGQPIAPPCAVVLGGETVVHLRGTGLGGRNQELALAAAPGIAGLQDVAVFSVGSDGTDGPTEAAGGIVTGDFCATCARQGLSIADTLADNDSFHLLEQTGALLVTGPTGTNVNDLMVVLVK